MGDLADAQSRVHLCDADGESGAYRGREVREAVRELALIVGPALADPHNSTTRRSRRIFGSPPEDLIASSVRKTAAIACFKRAGGIFSATHRNCPMRKNGTAPPSSASVSSRSASAASLRSIAFAIPKLVASAVGATTCF